MLLPLRRLAGSKRPRKIQPAMRHWRTVSGDDENYLYAIEAAEPTALNLRSPAGPQIGVAMARAAGNHPVLSDLGHREVINVACSFSFKCG
jgi:hypothetical protein